MDRLPIEDVLEDVIRALAAERDVVLVAPPGAGKTTRVPQAIVDRAPIAGGARVLILEPRRLAARLAAERIAAERGSRVGAEVGYQVRFDDKTSPRTRMAFLTEGILIRRIQSDPLLEGVSCVVLDEFHERSIHADLAIAFLRELQQTVRPDLRIVVMSATIDPGPVARFLQDAQVIESQGRLHPVEMVHLSERDERPLFERVVSGVRRALREEPDGGDVLAFLPGAPEIRRALEALVPLIGDRADVLPLYGELAAADQDRAVVRGARRKVVLATNIAESSLTIPGITIVVDAGYAKVPRLDPATGIDRLDTSRISRTSADQRAGRAGRTAPGRAYRLWTKAEDASLPPREVPEMARVDLAPAVLEIVRFAARDPRDFGWFERPPEASIERAERLLRLLGAIEAGAHRLTPRGEALAGVPAHPRIATLLLSSKRYGVLEDGALIAALASERDVVPRGAIPSDRVASSDLIVRAEAVEAGRVDRGALRGVFLARDRLLEIGRRLEVARVDLDASDEAKLLRAILSGFPDRVARRRGDRILLAGGGSARLAKESVVKDAELLVAVDVAAAPSWNLEPSKEALVRVASAIERRWLDEDTAGICTRARARWNASREAVECVREVRYLELVLEERPSNDAGEEEIARTLEEAARLDLDRALPKTDALQTLEHRIAFVVRQAPELAKDAGEGDLRLRMLPDLVRGRRSFSDLRALDLCVAARTILPHPLQSALDKMAPERIEVPSGRKVEVRYPPEGSPVVSVRLQEVFGMNATPRLGANRVPVTMELLAPNQRPVQVTQDLASFWVNTYPEVRRELARRYPKHQWPEDPRDGDPRKRPGRGRGRAS